MHDEIDAYMIFDVHDTIYIGATGLILSTGHSVHIPIGWTITVTNDLIIVKETANGDQFYA